MPNWQPTLAITVSPGFSESFFLKEGGDGIEEDFTKSILGFHTFYSTDKWTFTHVYTSPSTHTHLNTDFCSFRPKQSSTRIFLEGPFPREALPFNMQWYAMPGDISLELLVIQLIWTVRELVSHLVFPPGQNYKMLTYIHKSWHKEAAQSLQCQQT